MTKKSNFEDRRNELRLSAQEKCSVELTIKVIGGRWKCPIIHHLMDGTKRYNQLKTLIPDASQRMLTRNLRELERDGIVKRVVFDEVPPRTEYSLTETGVSLQPILWAMHDWAEQNLAT